jgi:hypothetical protein
MRDARPPPIVRCAARLHNCEACVGGYRDITTITMMTMNAATNANWNIHSLRCSRFMVLD